MSDPQSIRRLAAGIVLAALSAIEAAVRPGASDADVIRGNGALAWFRSCSTSGATAYLVLCDLLDLPAWRGRAVARRLAAGEASSVRALLGEWRSWELAERQAPRVRLTLSPAERRRFHEILAPQQCSPATAGRNSGVSSIGPG
jgi:hypothetical protein